MAHVSLTNGCGIHGTMEVDASTRLQAEGVQCVSISMDVVAPEDCATMEEVRAGVDSLDSRIVDLLGKRFAYMAAAARIKPERDMVRDEDRKAVVVAQVVRQAEKLGLPVETIALIWETLVEASIEFEMHHFDEKTQK